MAQPVYFKVLSPDAVVPRIDSDASPSSMDLHLSEDVELPVRECVLANHGFAMQPPAGCCTQVIGRSSSSYKRTLLVITGLIDCNYRGEIKTIVMNVGTEPIKLKKGERISQMTITQNRLHDLQVKVIPELDETKRGASGFGSTGT